MNTAYVLVLIGSLLFCIIPVIYMRGVHHGVITPNPASWFIWALVGSCNAVLYYLRAPQEEKFLAVLAILSAVAMTIVFFYTRSKHSFGKMGWAEWTSLVLTAFVLAVWMVTRKDDQAVRLAGVLIQAPMVIAFVPTCIALVWGEGQEKPLAWALGGTTYFFQITALSLSPEQDWTRYV